MKSKEVSKAHLHDLWMYIDSRHCTEKHQEDKEGGGGGLNTIRLFCPYITTNEYLCDDVQQLKNSDTRTISYRVYLCLFHRVVETHILFFFLAA